MDTLEFNQILNNFQMSLDYIYSLIIDPSDSRKFLPNWEEIRLDVFKENLARTADFLDFIGNPQTTYKSVHVAGTSGKGSVVTMISSLLTAVGQNTAHHISPYLQVSNEKLLINGRMISPSEFTDLVMLFKRLHQRYAQADREYQSIRYSEAWNIITFMWFAMCQVDWAVMETGMGGRYSPSNLLPSALAVITNVDYDHVKSLGPTLENIADHKAGIIKHDSLAITASENEAVLNVIRSEAKLKNAELFEYGKDYSFCIKTATPEGTIFSVSTPFNTYNNLSLNLAGIFQVKNAALAVTSLDILEHYYGLQISPGSIRKGLQNLSFTGRYEIIQSSPTVILDGAHNPHKIQSLVESLKEDYPGKKFTVIVGIVLTKDAQSILKNLALHTKRFIATQPHIFAKRSLPVNELESIMRENYPDIEIYAKENVNDAIDLALSLVNMDEIVIITGSLYLLGEARNYWIPSETILRNIEEEYQRLIHV